MAVLDKGGVVAFPTETVYGLGVRAGDRAARRRLLRAKDRASSKPFQILVSSRRKALDLCGGMRGTAGRLARAFWPGALTLVVKGRGGQWLGLRVPDHGLARRLVRRAGGAVVATSANRSGRAAARAAREVAEALGDRVDLILDGGRADAGTASSVVRAGEDWWELLREGAVDRAALEKAAGMPPRRKRSRR